MADLEIRNLHVSAEGKQILKGLDLEVSKGEVHALMGPNGSGKSTLANAIMGHPSLEVTEGEIRLRGEDITETDPEERARAGLFMAFQYPVAIPGVTVAKYLRMAVNAHREARGESEIKLKDFRKQTEAAMELMDIPREFSSRYLNDGFSGGEKKRMEILQLAMLQARARRARRDRLGPRHRRPADGGRGRQQVRRPRAGHPDHHPLPAHPPPGEAGLRARDVRRADRQGGRTGARRAARGARLRLDSRGGRGGRRRSGRTGMATAPAHLHRRGLSSRRRSAVRVPDPRAAGSRAAARLPGQRRDVAEAAGRDRGARPLLARAQRERPPRRPHALRGGDRDVRGRSRDDRPPPRQPSRARSSSPATSPGR